MQSALHRRPAHQSTRVPAAQSNDCRQQTQEPCRRISNARMPMRLNHCDPILFQGTAHLSVWRTYRPQTSAAPAGWRQAFSRSYGQRCPNSWRRPAACMAHWKVRPALFGVFSTTPRRRSASSIRSTRLRSSTTSFQRCRQIQSSLPSTLQHGKPLFQQEACNALTDTGQFQNDQGRWAIPYPSLAQPARLSIPRKQAHSCSESEGAGHSCP